MRRNQEEINKKISASLKGRVSPNRGCFLKGYDPKRGVWTKGHRQKAGDARKKNREELYQILPWSELPEPEKRRRILQEQEGKCLWCGWAEWRGKKITLELDHADGVKTNVSRENLRYLCPNCHSQTPTWRRKK
jgi:hypothetical protein